MGASPPGKRGKPVANPWNTGRLTRDPSPKYGLSTHFFMLSDIHSLKSARCLAHFLLLTNLLLTKQTASKISNPTPTHASSSPSRFRRNPLENPLHTTQIG